MAIIYFRFRFKKKNKNVKVVRDKICWPEVGYWKIVYGLYYSVRFVCFIELMFVFSFLQSFIFVVCALVVASVSCGKYGAAPASVYNANSYALGPEPLSYAAPSPAYPSASYSSAAYPSPSYPAHSYPTPSYPSPSYPARAYASKLKYSVQPAYSQELYPGQNNYKSYHSAPVYSQVALPIVPSDPVAKLYVPPQHSYAPASSYGAIY